MAGYVNGHRVLGLNMVVEGGVSDVEVDGVSVVDDDGVANIDLSGKQDTLTAGDNITIDENNVISASGGGSGTVDQTYNAISTNAQSGTAVEQGISSIRSKANNALNMLGEVPEETDVQSEIDRLNSIVSILRDLAKKSTYTEDVTSLVAELDSYFVDSGITQNGSILTIKSDVTATQSGTALTLN